MSDETISGPAKTSDHSVLAGPSVNPVFVKSLDELVAAARQGHSSHSAYCNPSDKWLINNMRVFQDTSHEMQAQTLIESNQLALEAKLALAEGKAAKRAWPDVAVRLDTGGLAFFSQLGVARRPDLTQYFIDGFLRNRDAVAFSEENQALFAEIFPYITNLMMNHFAEGDTIVQSDRQIGDGPDRSIHARQLLFGTRYLQIPYMWRQLTFDLPEPRLANEPDILEISIPMWLEDLNLPDNLKSRIEMSGLTQLVFKAPTKGLSLHLGFDYVGEHKMGPLSIAMYQVKQDRGIAIQAALSMATVRSLDGAIANTALVTTGPSLHGKSTLTIMIELANSKLASLLGLTTDSKEGVYPMNDDIVLLQRLKQPIEANRGGRKIRITHSIDGTENNFYAVPFGLNRHDDPITYDVVRGSEESPNHEETLENVLVNIEESTPDFSQNPVRNMRMILSRSRLVAKKRARHLIEQITEGQLSDSVHVPMENVDRIFWQSVMRQNTVVPPLRRLVMEQYIRVLMYGEAVQMGAATGVIGLPYVEYFSDPFIIGLEDDNANLMYQVLQEMSQGGLPNEYYVFNTGGVGAESDDKAAGPNYKKIPRELTLMLQEALLRNAVKFEFDPTLRSDVAVAIVDKNDQEVLDLRPEWLPRSIYGESEYCRRVEELSYRRYYGRDAGDKAGILRYTKVSNDLIDLSDIPTPSNERELAWLLSFFWNVDEAYASIDNLVKHRHEGQEPDIQLTRSLKEVCKTAGARGLALSEEILQALVSLGLH